MRQRSRIAAYGVIRCVPVIPSIPGFRVLILVPDTQRTSHGGRTPCSLSHLGSNDKARTRRAYRFLVGELRLLAHTCTSPGWVIRDNLATVAMFKFAPGELVEARFPELSSQPHAKNDKARTKRASRFWLGD